jgi:hypothetical protein
MPTYSLKKVKAGMGQDGVSYSADLYRDGKKVAEVADYSDGGPEAIHWLDWEAGNVLINGLDHNYVGTKEEKLFIEFVITQTYMCLYEGEKVPHTAGTYLGEMVDTHFNEKMLKRACKTKTVYRLKDDAKGEYVTLPRPYNAEIKAALVKKYGDRLEEVINERYNK